MATVILDLIPDVIADLPGVPDPVAESAIRRAAIDLCANAGVWRHKPAPIAVVAGTASYAIPTPSGSRVESILEASVGGRPLALPGDSVSTAGIAGLLGAPVAASLDPFNGGVLIAPVPASDLSLDLIVTLVPSVAAAEIPDLLANRYADTLAHGARARLMMMLRQPWSDPAMAQAEAAMFSDGVSEAHIAMLRGSSLGTLRVRPRAFGG